MMKTAFRLVLNAIIVFYAAATAAQEDVSNPYEGPQVQNRFILEGGLGMQFGSITFVEISPAVGYKLTKNFVPGIGLTWQYSEYRDYFLNTQTNETVSRKNNIYGIRAFARYFIPAFTEVLNGNLFLHAEYEYLTFERDFRLDATGAFMDPYGYPYSKGKERLNVPGILIGGGLSQRFGGRVFANILFLYNLNQTKETPYSNPVIRFGIGAGF